MSVVIAVRDEEEYIGDCLSDISRQNYPQDKFEIIIVDDNSNDNSVKIIRDFQEKMENVKLIEIKESIENFAPKKYALSEGIKKSSGEIILTTDGDCRLKPTWIESMVKNFDLDSGMVAGFSQIGERGKVDSVCIGVQAVDFLSLMTAAAGSISAGLPLAASGQNLSYRREAFDKVGGFSKIRDRISGDDILLLQLIKKYTNFSVNFSFNPDSFVCTHPSESIREFINQRIRWASNAFYQRKTDIPFLVYLINLYLLNVCLLIFLPLSLIFKGFGYIPVYCLVIKWITDLVLLLKGAETFGRTDLLRFFILWEIFQPIYFAFVGITGIFGRFTWKGRKYR